MEFLKSIFLFKALNSACGRPFTDVIPELITELFLTTTHPTEGFLVFLNCIQLYLKLDLKKNYDLVSSKLPTNSSKSFASLKFLYTDANRT